MADPARCIHVLYVGALFAEIVIIFKKVFVNHVKDIKLEISLNHSNKYPTVEII